MKDAELEALLLAARPHHADKYSVATTQIMEHITSQRQITTYLNDAPRSRSLITRLQALHGLSLVLAIIIAAICMAGVVYASTQIVPDIIRVFNKKQTTTGRIEYDAPAFAHCYQKGDRSLDKFDVSPAAHLSDQEVEKILTAKCELMRVDAFIKSKWPTYGDHATWREGDHIYYTRADVLGEVQSIDTQTLVLSNGNANPVQYKAFNNRPIQAYLGGKPVDIAMIKPNDYVFSVVRVSEVYHTPETLRGPHANEIMQNHTATSLGLVAVIKMSLPERYYTTLQNYIEPVVACTGNPSEHCPGELSGVMIDVFPRDEALTNPYARPDSSDLQAYEITGMVTALTSESVTIKASSGAQYVLTMDTPVIDTYNSGVAPTYPWPPDKTQVQIGSRLEILYRQKPGENHLRLRLSDLRSMQIITGIQPKAEPEG